MSQLPVADLRLRGVSRRRSRAHRALGVRTLVAVVTGVIGVFTVMRGQSFAGEAFGDLVGAPGGAGAYLVGVRAAVSDLGRT